MQLRKDGPPVLVPAELAVHLGLALHELGTHALKYGAWSVPGGQVRLTWQLVEPVESGTRRLSLTWSEHDGPVVRAPTHSGFGTTLIERGIPDATVTRSFAPSGLVCRIEQDLPVVRPEFLG